MKKTTLLGTFIIMIIMNCAILLNWHAQKNFKKAATTLSTATVKMDTITLTPEEQVENLMEAIDQHMLQTEQLLDQADSLKPFVVSAAEASVLDDSHLSQEKIKKSRIFLQILKTSAQHINDAEVLLQKATFITARYNVDVLKEKDLFLGGIEMFEGMIQEKKKSIQKNAEVFNIVKMT